MGRFRDDMRARLPDGMSLPEEIGALFDWIDERGLVHPSQRVRGDRFGTLLPLDATEVGTIILFRVETQAEAEEFIEPWFGRGADVALARRLVCFARTGADGSQAAFWLDDEGRQHIVHLGSEGDSVCVLGREPLDFLRLLAIGYTELTDGLSNPQAPPKHRETDPNPVFRSWLATTFHAEAPARAAEIVMPSDSDATQSDDPFWNWVKAQVR